MQGLFQSQFLEYDAKHPLPSWQGATKDAILAFVASVSDEKSSHFVPLEDRIAVFDNDGTLWCEQPIPIQVQFAFARFAEMVKVHPELASNDALKAGARGDLAGLLKNGKDDAIHIVMDTHTEISVNEFIETARKWYYAAKHPERAMSVPNLVYLPMIELLVHLKKCGFTSYIASAGGQDFMRAIAQDRYGIPTERVIGSQFKTVYEFKDGTMQIVRKAGIANYDDGPVKPVNIQHSIGKCPIFAFGNSDGDYEMLDWVSQNSLPHMALILHHTDGEREWAYDAKTLSGTLIRGLKDATAKGWYVVDMKSEWARVFPEAE